MTTITCNLALPTLDAVNSTDITSKITVVAIGTSSYKVTLLTADIFVLWGGATASNVILPTEIILNIDNPTIAYTIFTREVNINMSNRIGINLTFSSFSCNSSLGDSTDLSVFGTVNNTIYINNVTFIYSDRQCISTLSNSTIIDSGGPLPNKSSSININAGTNISLYSLTSPADLVTKFNLNLIGGEYLFAPINNESITFNLLGNTTIKNTFIESECLFNTSSYDLNFSGCTFTSRDEAKYLGRTSGTGNISFTSTYGNTLFFPFSVKQVETLGIWENTSANFNVDEIPAINMYLPEGTYSNFDDLTYFNKSIVYPSSTSTLFTFGSSLLPLSQDLNLTIANTIDTNNDSKTTLEFLIYTNGGSVYLNQINTDIQVKFIEGTTISASEYTAALVDSRDDKTTEVPSIILSGTYTNNNVIIFEKTLDISLTVPSNLTANYEIADARIDLSEENSILHNYDNLWLTGADLHLYIPIELDSLFEFKNTSGASLSGSDIRSRILLNLQSNFTIDSSYVDVITSGTYIFDVPQNTPITNPQTIPLYVFTLQNSVIDVPNLYTSSILIIGNIGSNTGHSLTGNTINIVEPDASPLSFNLTNIDYDKTYFKDTNIFNMVCGSNTTVELVYGSSFTNISKSLNIASSSTISEFTSISNIINIGPNCSFNIVGDKLHWVDNDDNGYDVESEWSDCTITFKNITFSGSTGATETLINYSPTNNQLNLDGDNIKLSFINTNFYTINSINSLTTDFVTATNYVEATVTNPDFLYKVYLIGDGNFALGNDPLVLLSDTVYFNNGNSSNATLYGTNSTTLYPTLLTIIVESVDVSSSDVNLIVKAANGLDIIDNCITVHNINLNSGTEINVTNGNAITITANTANSLININDLTTISTTTPIPLVRTISVILINDATQTATPNRLLTIAAGITFESDVKHFITNNDTMLLNINSVPIQNAYLTHNFIFWPKLREMSTMEQRVEYPLSGTAVKYAEAWSFYNDSSIYPTSLINTYSDGTNGTTPGLAIDASNEFNDTTTQDWNNKNLRYLNVYSKDALSGISYFNITLDKDHTNTSTKHTGKLDNNGDSKQLDDSDAKGWLDCVINFTVSELALMPYLNYVELNLVPFSNAGEIQNSTSSTHAYVINQNQLITKTINDTVLEYSVKGYLEATITNNVLRAVYADGDYYSRIDPIQLIEEEIIINDPDQTEPYDTITTKISQTIYYNITPVSGSVITLSTDANYVIINSVSSGDEAGAFTYANILYPNIDNINPEVRSGSSGGAEISVADDPDVWTTKTINVSINIGTYQQSGTVDFTFDIENQANDNKLSGIPLESIGATIQTPVNVDVTNTVTFTNKDFTKNVSTYILTTYIALYSRIISSGGYELINGTLLINDDTTETPRGTATFTKWVYYNGVWMTYTAANTLAGSEVYNNKVDITDTIIRYQIDIVINNISSLDVNTNYTVNFTLSDVNTPQIITTPLNINIQFLNIPLVVTLSTNSGNTLTSRDIYTTYDQTTHTHDFSLFVNFSANFTGKVSLAFTNKENAGNQYDMTYFMDNIKLVDSTINNVSPYLSPSSTLTPFGALNDETTEDPIDRVGTNQVQLKYRFSPTVIPGTFYINVALNEFKKLADNADITLGDNVINTLTLHYLETRRHTIGITIGKVLNGGNPPREVIADVDVTDGYTVTVQDDTNVSTNDVKLVPTIFTFDDAIASADVKPFNKYTQYYLSVDTSSLGFIYNEPTSISDSRISVYFTFRDNSENIVNDIELINANDITPLVPSTSITIDNLVSQNFNPVGAGNVVFVFRRKLTAFGITEQTYTNLKIYYSFSNVSGTNYANLGTSEHLLATIDYSNYGTSSQKFSEICIGNWRIVPSGDGAKLLFNRIESGNNPYDVTIPMTPTDIGLKDEDSNDSALIFLHNLNLS